MTERLHRPSLRPSPAGGPSPSSGAAPGGTVLPFRPRASVVRRKLRRHPVVRWGRPLVAALLIVGAPCTAVWWLMTSPRLAVEELVVSSGPRVGERWIRRTLEPTLGRNLLQLPLDQVARDLEAHPWVQAARVTKELPGTLRVEVLEKEPAAILRRDGDLLLVDADGLEIEGVRPGDRSTPDLPLVGGRDGREPELEELVAGIALARRLEAEGWGDRDRVTVSEVEVLGVGDHRVWFREEDFPVLLRVGGPAHDRQKLVQLLPEVRRRFDVVGIDLRFEDRIIVRTGGEVALRVEEEKG